MAKAKTPTTTEDAPSTAIDANVLAEAIAKATQAQIEQSRPQKKTINTRTKDTPWTPKDGSKKLKFKRKTYQHGQLLNELRFNNNEITKFNKLRPGKYCNGFVRVVETASKGIDLSYPVKTAAQRLRLVNDFGIRNLEDLLDHCITEAANPPKRVDELED